MTNPVHEWFCLTYSSYVVLQRSILQSMPVEWQTRFVRLMQQIDAAASNLPDIPESFRVLGVDDRGRFVRDPYRDYERGRRRVRLCAAPSAAGPNAENKKDTDQ